jgi:hypothetical protein
VAVVEKVAEFSGVVCCRIGKEVGGWLNSMLGLSPVKPVAGLPHICSSVEW